MCDPAAGLTGDKLALCAVALSSFIAIGSMAPALAQTRPDGSSINRLIPQTPGKTACFAGTFANVPIDEEFLVPPGIQGGAFGKRFVTHKVGAVVLQVEYEDTPPLPDSKDIAGYTRRYDFRLSVKLAGERSLLHAAGECWWRD